MFGSILRTGHFFYMLAPLCIVSGNVPERLHDGWVEGVLVLHDHGAELVVEPGGGHAGAQVLPQLQVVEGRQGHRRGDLRPARGPWGVKGWAGRPTLIPPNS